MAYNNKHLFYCLRYICIYNCGLATMSWLGVFPFLDPDWRRRPCLEYLFLRQRRRTKELTETCNALWWMWHMSDMLTFYWPKHIILPRSKSVGQTYVRGIKYLWAIMPCTVMAFQASFCPPKWLWKIMGRNRKSSRKDGFGKEKD